MKVGEKISPLTHESVCLNCIFMSVQVFVEVDYKLTFYVKLSILELSNRLSLSFSLFMHFLSVQIISQFCNTIWLVFWFLLMFGWLGSIFHRLRPHVIGQDNFSKFERLSIILALRSISIIVDDDSDIVCYRRLWILLVSFTLIIILFKRTLSN